MYLHYQFVPEPFTLLSGVHKLPAAHTLTLSADSARDATPQPLLECGNLRLGIWRGVCSTDTPGILASIRTGLEDAVKMTLRADVLDAVALSGGIDLARSQSLRKSNIRNRCTPLRRVNPGRPHYDERKQARALAESLGMIVHEVELPVESFVSFFPDLARIMDEPIADPAAFGHYSVPKAAAENGIKVLLTGIGGTKSSGAMTGLRGPPPPTSCLPTNRPWPRSRYGPASSGPANAGPDYPQLRMLTSPAVG